MISKIEKTKVRGDVYDIRCLMKLLKKATKLRCYKADAKSSLYSAYNSPTTEYKEDGAHIQVKAGGWDCKNGGEYKISIYLPLLRVNDRGLFNLVYARTLVDSIIEALNEEFGEEGWSVSNEEQCRWRPLGRLSFYLQIPNFK